MTHASLNRQRSAHRPICSSAMDIQISTDGASLAPDPEQQASNSEVRRLLEEAVEKLPDAYRIIFILRDIEEMSTTDAADVLEITEDNVKVRLHRARRCYERVFTRVLAWKEKKHSIFMPCGAIEWLRMSLKEFSSGP